MVHLKLYYITIKNNIQYKVIYIYDYSHNGKTDVGRKRDRLLHC